MLQLTSTTSVRQEAIDAARANPFRAFVGSIASGAGAGAIVSDRPPKLSSDLWAARVFCNYAVDYARLVPRFLWADAVDYA